MCAGGNEAGGACKMTSSARWETIGAVQAKERQVTSRSHAKSEALYVEAQQYLAGGVNSNFRLGVPPLPLFFERAQGGRLYDVDGNEYVDYMLGMGPVVLGHNAPAPVRAERSR